MLPTSRSAFAFFFSRSLTRSKTATPTAAELQRRYLNIVYNYVTARIGAGAEAEDVTAEVFGAAFTQLHRCPAPSKTDNDDPIRAWLIGIARRKLADVFRRRTRRPETALQITLPAPATESPESCALADEATHTLEAILADLPELQREALLLKYRDELSLEEIAQILGKSPNAVGQLLFRARQAVRTRGLGYFGDETTQETEL